LKNSSRYCFPELEIFLFGVGNVILRSRECCSPEPGGAFIGTVDKRTPTPIVV